MTETILAWLESGLAQAAWWQMLLFVLLATHLTIISVTVFLHRAQAHRALDLHPALAHVFRFWLWLTTGMVTREWVAVHRRHHARCETPEDPHSPQVKGLRKVLWQGAELYHEATLDSELVERYGHGTPDDWVERNVYSRLRWQGPALMLIIDLALFGAIGGAVWAVQMLWIPILAAGVINGVGHYWGYRNFESPDAATNVVPWGILIGGEELHNNHHAFPSSARLSSRWWEFDLGWAYIRLFEFLRLARVRRVAMAPRLGPQVLDIDLDMVRVLVRHRMFLLASYAKDVVVPVARAELAERGRRGWRDARRLLVRARRLDPPAKVRLENLLAENAVLRTVYEYRQRLQALWEETSPSQAALVKSLEEWCRQAEHSGVRALAEFSLRLRSLRSVALPAA